MDFTKSQFVSYILAYGGVIGIIWFLFEKAEDTLKPKVKKDISKWLKNLDALELVENWPGQFVAVFDRIFGENHFSAKCFLRSFLASFAALIIMTLIWRAIRPGEITELLKNVDLLFGTVTLFFALAHSLNVIPDYISLLETRLIIRWISLRSSALLTLGLLILDIIITYSIFYVFFWILLFISTNRLQSLSWEVWKGFLSGHLLVAQVEFITKSGEENFNLPIGIFFYTTFFTSAWVWLYALSGFIVKLTQKLNISLNWLKKYLDIDEKPLRSMALVSIMIVTVIFIVVPFLR